MKSRFGIYGALMAGVFMLSASGIFAKLAVAPPTVTAFYRLLFAVLALLPVLLANSGARAELFSLSRKEFVAGVLAGFFLAVHYVMYFTSVHYTNVSTATVLAALQPVFSMVWGALFLKERVTKKALFGCAVALFGTVIIGGGDYRISGLALLGDVIALGSAGLISLYYLFGQISRRSVGVLAYSVLSYSCSVFFLTIFVLLSGNSFTGYSAATWHCFLGLTFISTIGGQMIFNLLLRWVSATTVTMGILAEPLGTFVLAWYFLGERPGLQLCFGMVFILAGLGMFFMNAQKSEG